MVSYYHTDVMIDCGEDWLHRFEQLRPAAILITHPHPDHALGLKNGTPCPVYATEEAWENMADFPVAEHRMIKPRQPTEIGGIIFEPFPAEHSTRAPAVGYRITAGRPAVFYIPDVVYIHEREEALKGVRLYIGDGATITRPIVRKPKERLIGHTPVGTQLTWCRKEGVPEAVISHCGSEIVGGDERKVGAKIRRMAEERGVKVTIAYDGMMRLLR
jgi:phosphoribosyl 1,2-cyclic phosphodiesterase